MSALENLSRSQLHPVLTERWQSVQRDLRQGQALSAGLAEHFPDMPRFVSNLAELGEATGQLDKALRDAVTRMESEQKVRRDIRSALTYPAVLATVGGAVVLLMFLFVVPRFGAMISRTNADIPYMSRIVIEAGLWASENRVLLLLLIFGGGAAIIFAMRRYREQLLAVLRKAPGFGSLLRKSDLSNFTRTMGVALANGAHLNDALKLSERSATTPLFARQVARMRTAVRAGEPLEVAIEKNLDHPDPLLIDLIRTGRQSGALDDMLLTAAELFQDDIDVATKRLTALAEPIAIVLLSVIVGGLVLSIVMAMTSLYEFGV